MEDVNSELTDCSSSGVSSSNSEEDFGEKFISDDKRILTFPKSICDYPNTQVTILGKLPANYTVDVMQTVEREVQTMDNKSGIRHSSNNMPTFQKMFSHLPSHMDNATNSADNPSEDGDVCRCDTTEAMKRESALALNEIILKLRKHMKGRARGDRNMISGCLEPEIGNNNRDEILNCGPDTGCREEAVTIKDKGLDNFNETRDKIILKLRKHMKGRVRGDPNMISGCVETDVANIDEILNCGPDTGCREDAVTIKDNGLDNLNEIFNEIFNETGCEVEEAKREGVLNCRSDHSCRDIVNLKLDNSSETKEPDLNSYSCEKQDSDLENCAVCDEENDAITTCENTDMDKFEKISKDIEAIKEKLEGVPQSDAVQASGSLNKDMDLHICGKFCIRNCHQKPRDYSEKMGLWTKPMPGVRRTFGLISEGNCKSKEIVDPRREVINNKQHVSICSCLPADT